MASYGVNIVVKLLSWMPKLLCYDNYAGNWDNFIADVYTIFENDFKTTKPIFRTLPVNHDSRIIDGREAGFWHIVQKEDNTTGTRIPDFRRCEHIPWPKPIIENCNDSEVWIWDKEIKKSGYGRQVRVVLWLEKFDYVVILRVRSKEMILVTAYCVIYESHKKKLQLERNEYIKQKTPRRAA